MSKAHVVCKCRCKNAHSEMTFHLLQGHVAGLVWMTMTAALFSNSFYLIEAIFSFSFNCTFKLSFIFTDVVKKDVFSIKQAVWPSNQDTRYKI